MRAIVVFGFALLLLFLHITFSSSLSEEQELENKVKNKNVLPFDPSRLLISTVLDSSSPRIISDAKLLFHSLRLFGGSLNKATLLACIVVDPKEAFTDEELLGDLERLGVKVDLVRQVNAPFAKTMNKFSSFFRVDVSQFDYFLWLDADIVILGDPVPFFPPPQDGKIYCVKELNNYMRRFPSWSHPSNFSEFSSLEPFTLEGESSVAPHGVCNLGMLLFHSSSLLAFQHQLSDEHTIRMIQVHVRDRFVDSLCFVLIVNFASIEVVPLDYSLNYFVLLEEEVRLGEASPLIAHFMADSELEIRQMPDDPQKCTCLMHRNEPFLDSSIAFRMLQERCSIICEHIRHFNQAKNGDTSNLSESNKSQSNDSFVPYCNGECVEKTPPDAAKQQSSSYFLEVLWPIDRTVVFAMLTQCSVEVFLSHSKLDDASKMYVSFDDVEEYSVVESFSECDTNNFCKLSMQMDIDIPPHKLKAVDFYMNMTLSIRSNQNLLRVAKSVEMRVICQGNLSPSTTGFSLFPSNDIRPFSLSSQYNLAPFLNLRGLHGLGVIECCDTVQGLESTKRIVTQWGHRIRLDKRLHLGGLNDGRILIILLLSTPSAMSGVDDLRIDLESHCNSRKVHRNESGFGKEHMSGCVVLQDPSAIAFLRKNIQQQRARALSFVYSDVFVDFHSHVRELRQWFDSLQPGGVLMGSQYYMPLPQLEVLPHVLKAVQIRSAVDSNAFDVWRVPVLVTYSDMAFNSDVVVGSPESFGGQVSAVPRYPAWYVFSNARCSK